MVLKISHYNLPREALGASMCMKLMQQMHQFTLYFRQPQVLLAAFKVSHQIIAQVKLV